MPTKIVAAFFFSIFITSHSYSQSSLSKFDIRLGSGISFMGSGDLFAMNIENEINYRFSPYFSSSISLLAGKSYSDRDTKATIFATNLNVFLSPFANNRNIDFRIGSGLCYTGIEEISFYQEILAATAPANLYIIESWNTFGLNLILENSININPVFFAGLKAFSQRLFSGDINSGILLKIGVRI